MRVYVISQQLDECEQWPEKQREPRRLPEQNILQAREQTPVTYGSALCRRIRGTEARGQVGPDLTHFGSRMTIGAGTLPNTQANREAWIVSSQHLKPDNHMPNYLLEGDKLLALAAYLGSLE